MTKRAQEGQFLTTEEYKAFKRHAGYRVSEDKGTLKGSVAQLRCVQRQVSEKKLDDMIHATHTSSAQVAANTRKLRLRLLHDYLNYLFTTFHATAAPTAQVSITLGQLCKAIRLDIKSIRKDNCDVRDPYAQAIPDSTFFKLLDITRVHSAQNPWKGARLRNQLIVALLSETGVRRGALAKIKISNFKRRGDQHYLLVTRTPGDPTDSRKLPASQKTRAHTAPISNSLMKLIRHYINTERSQSQASLQHDFLLVSQKGKTAGMPIALSTINGLFNTLSQRLELRIHPHLLRHKWNEIFSMKAKAQGYSMEQIEDLRKYAMGWSINSSMGSLYNEFHNAISVLQIAQARQKAFLTDGECENVNKAHSK
ncbi:site-specific integrase [Ferrimonas futtsuensis]|uniref:site-specific integrase n=1 Tax=Ferrimonas futtsuensis TaxID=364764 RepID=UPI00146D30EE|nr:site-specific integrase [Ferrimonas futtsuensis]